MGTEPKSEPRDAPRPASDRQVSDGQAARRQWLGRLAATTGGLAAGGLLGPGMPAAHAQGGLSRYRTDEDPLSYAPRAALPPGYPDAYLETIRAAEDEGRLVIYSTTDTDVAAPLIDDFRFLYPRIQVDYDDQTATELNFRFIAESQLGRSGADVLWSSAMDQQAALIERGDALAYESPQAGGLPSWARIGNLGWSTTLEPIGLVHDRRRLDGKDVPRSHADLRRLLEGDPARFERKVVMYDVPKSGVGYLLATHDAARMAEYNGLVAAIGRCRPRLTLTADAMLRAVESGDALIAYNVLGDYALARASRQPSLGVVFPSDFTLVLSRVMFISRHAEHPNAARLWVDYLLSRRGQEVLANRSRLHSVRDDVQGDRSAAALRAQLGPSMKPIDFDRTLGQALEPARYAAFIGDWRRAMGRPVRR